MGRHIGKVIRKISMIGILALGLVLAGMQPGMRHRIAASTRNFQQSFRDLKATGNSLNPIERFVFSVVLASTTPSPSGT
jgi:hypothetical protein